MTPSNPVVKLLPYQYEFLTNRSRYKCLAGGLGTGKTYVATHCALDLMKMNPGCNGLGAEPTGPQLIIFREQMDQTCDALGIRTKYRGPGGNSPASYTFNFGHGEQKLWLVSAENYKRTMVGLNVAFGFVDEADTVPNFEEALGMWNALNDRVRDPKAKLRQSFMTTSPEGYHLAHHVFVEKAADNKFLMNVSSFENKYLSNAYLNDQLARYTKQQALAKVYGQFVNANEGNVYYQFSRALAPEGNNTKKTLLDIKENPVHIGMDFNIGKMSATIAYMDAVSGKSYVVKEITSEFDTDSMILAIKKMLPWHWQMCREGYQAINIYPDTSGKNASANSSVSSITKLQQAFGRQSCHFRGNNPSILKERVPAVNAAFKNSLDETRLYVNVNECPVLVQGLEQQGYRDGKPDKSGDLDHALDALGYFVHFTYPIVGRATYSIS
jgi:hypothetical protein